MEHFQFFFNAILVTWEIFSKMFLMIWFSIYWFNFANLYFSENYSFFVDSQICWHNIANKFAFYSLALIMFVFVICMSSLLLISLTDLLTSFTFFFLYFHPLPGFWIVYSLYDFLDWNRVCLFSFPLKSFMSMYQRGQTGMMTPSGVSSGFNGD